MWLRRGYNEKGISKEAANFFFPPRAMWCAFLCYDWCHKKLIELSAQGFRGQTHPVRSRLVASHREGLGGCDLLIVRGMMDWEGGRGKLQCATPANYEENQWRQEVTRGGWAILSPPDARFYNWGGKQEVEKEKERGKHVQQGAVLLRIF